MAPLTLLGLAWVTLVASGCKDGRADAAKVQTARLAVRAVAVQATLYAADHPYDGCPTIEQLKADLPKGDKFDSSDPWGHPFVIECDHLGGETVVTSTGPDGRLGTEDDVRSKG